MSEFFEALGEKNSPRGPERLAQNGVLSYVCVYTSNVCRTVGESASCVVGISPV